MKKNEIKKLKKKYKNIRRKKSTIDATKLVFGM